MKHFNIIILFMVLLSCNKQQQHDIQDHASIQSTTSPQACKNFYNALFAGEVEKMKSMLYDYKLINANNPVVTRGQEISKEEYDKEDKIVGDMTGIGIEYEDKPFSSLTGATFLHHVALMPLKNVEVMAEVMEELIKFFPQAINSKTVEGGDTPLMGAALRGRIKLVEVLLNKGAKVNEVSNFDNNAAHAAVLGGDLNVLKLLVEHKVDLNQKNAMKYTPYELAFGICYGQFTTPYTKKRIKNGSMEQYKAIQQYLGSGPKPSKDAEKGLWFD